MPGSTVKFKVSPNHKLLYNFSIQIFGVFCYNVLGPPGSGQSETRSFYVPKAKISRNGKFTGTWKPKDSSGNQIGTFTLTGKFTSAHKAHGSAQFVGNPCYGTLQWTARHR